MKKLLFLTIVSLMMAGCVAVPVYDNGYYPYYGPYPYPYAFVGPEVSVFVPVFHGGHRFHVGHEFRGGHTIRGGHAIRGGDGFRGGNAVRGGGGFRGGRR